MKYCVVFLVLVAVALCEDKKEEKKPIEKGDINNGTVIGIDLGTTYSCVGVFKSGRVEIIANDQGNRITPSYVAFTEDGERLIGDAAKNQLTRNPKNTVFDAKRMIGRSWSDPALQKDREYFPFTTKSINGKPSVEVTTGEGVLKTFTPEEISAMVLTKMKETAEAYLGTKVQNAVVTVPAYFNDAQRAATKDAGTIAGLNILRIINEPTAAAIAYGLDKKGEKSVLVFDLGGGTFDVSLLMIENGVFEVVATNGDTHLGGEDFDQRVIAHFVKLYKKKTGKDLTTDQRAVQKLRREVEKAKRALSSQHQTRIEIESILDGEDFAETLTRARFEELNMDLFKSTMIPVQKVMKDAQLDIKDIDEIVLVGGSTRIPKVQQLVKEFFNGKEPSKGINPDEAVAYGAAVQGGILGGEDQTKGIILLDVCPLSLGFTIEGGVMQKMIKRNSVIPTKKSDVFTTTTDNQDAIYIDVCEGERAMSADNHQLGNFKIDGLKLAKRGVPQVQVTFEVDNNGVLHVSAKDLESGKEESIKISNDQNRLKPEDIKRMVDESEKFAEEDNKVRLHAQGKSELEYAAYNLQAKLEDDKGLGGKCDGKDKITLRKAIEKAVAVADDAENKDHVALKAARMELESTSRVIINKINAAERKEEEDKMKNNKGKGEL